MEDDDVSSIADMVARDYDGSEDVDRATVLSTLRTWSRNSPKARKIIDKLGDNAVTHYEIAWRDAHATEYDLDNEEDDDAE